MQEEILSGKRWDPYIPKWNGYRTGKQLFAIMSSDEFKKGKKIAPLIKDEKGI